jgi:hypothetical protein
MRLVREEIIEAQEYAPIGQAVIALDSEFDDAIVLGLDKVQNLAVIRNDKTIGIVKITCNLGYGAGLGNLIGRRVDQMATLARTGEIDPAILVRRIIACDNEFSAASRQDGRRAAAICFQNSWVFLAVPGHDGTAAIFDIIELVLVPDGAFGKPGIAIDDLGIGRMGASREAKGEHNAENASFHHVISFPSSPASANFTARRRRFLVFCLRHRRRALL